MATRKVIPRLDSNFIANYIANNLLLPLPPLPLRVKPLPPPLIGKKSSKIPRPITPVSANQTSHSERIPLPQGPATPDISYGPFFGNLSANITQKTRNLIDFDNEYREIMADSDNYYIDFNKLKESTERYVNLTAPYKDRNGNPLTLLRINEIQTGMIHRYISLSEALNDVYQKIAFTREMGLKGFSAAFTIGGPEGFTSQVREMSQGNTRKGTGGGNKNDAIKGGGAFSYARMIVEGKGAEKLLHKSTVGSDKEFMIIVRPQILNSRLSAVNVSDGKGMTPGNQSSILGARTYIAEMLRGIHLTISHYRAQNETLFFSRIPLNMISRIVIKADLSGANAESIKKEKIDAVKKIIEKNIGLLQIEMITGKKIDNLIVVLDNNTTRNQLLQYGIVV